MRWTLPLFATALSAGLAASSLQGVAMPVHSPLTHAAILPAAAQVWPGLLLGTPDSPAVRAWRGFAREARARLAIALGRP